MCWLRTIWMFWVRKSTQRLFRHIFYKTENCDIVSREVIWSNDNSKKSMDLFILNLRVRVLKYKHYKAYWRIVLKQIQRKNMRKRAWLIQSLSDSNNCCEQLFSLTKKVS